jgi:hypothetical protein
MCGGSARLPRQGERNPVSGDKPGATIGQAVLLILRSFRSSLSITAPRWSRSFLSNSRRDIPHEHGVSSLSASEACAPIPWLRGGIR